MKKSIGTGTGTGSIVSIVPNIKFINMPLFRSYHLQTLTSCLVGLLYFGVVVRLMMLLNTTATATTSNPLIKLNGSIRHASFIKLLPFGFTGQSSQFDMEITIKINKMTSKHASELQLTNRTIFELLLCNEEEWKTIKSVIPSYCHTASYQQRKLCRSFPLNMAIDTKKAPTGSYLSKSRVQHEVSERFFGRLIVSSCELQSKTLKRYTELQKTDISIEDQVEMTLSSGLTMSNGGIKTHIQYIGFENDSQQMLVMIMLLVYVLLAVVWSLLLIIQRATVIRLQARFFNILISKMVLFFFKYVYWIKRERGDVWSTYKDEMLQLHSAMQMLALAVMLECVLLVSVGWSITQKNLSQKSHHLIYFTLGGYFLSIFVYVVSSRLTTSIKSYIPLLEIIAFLAYLVATFSTYYVIGFSTSANIQALETQLHLIERYMGVQPSTTPSWMKLSMFTKFRTWVVVFVTATILTDIGSLIIRGNDDHEKYDLWVDAVSYTIELIAVVALLFVFRPKKKSSYFRQIPVLEIDDNNSDEARFVPALDGQQEDSSAATIAARLRRLPTVTGVILTPYQDQQPLPPVVVGRLLDARRRVVVHPGGHERNNVEMVEVVRVDEDVDEDVDELNDGTF